MWTAADLVEYLGQLVNSDEKYDGVPARPHVQEPVRLMNLHKAKGRAPIVFLADPAGEFDHPPTLHIDRLEARVAGTLLCMAKPRDVENRRSWQIHPGGKI